MGFLGILVWHSRGTEYTVYYENDTQKSYNTNPVIVFNTQCIRCDRVDRLFPQTVSCSPRSSYVVISGRDKAGMTRENLPIQ